MTSSTRPTGFASAHEHGLWETLDVDPPPCGCCGRPLTFVTAGCGRYVAACRTRETAAVFAGCRSADRAADGGRGRPARLRDTVFARRFDARLRSTSICAMRSAKPRRGPMSVTLDATGVDLVTRLAVGRHLLRPRRRRDHSSLRRLRPTVPPGMVEPDTLDDVAVITDAGTASASACCAAARPGERGSTFVRGGTRVSWTPRSWPLSSVVNTGRRRRCLRLGSRPGGPVEPSDSATIGLRTRRTILVAGAPQHLRGRRGSREPGPSQRSPRTHDY